MLLSKIKKLLFRFFQITSYLFIIIIPVKVYELYNLYDELRYIGKGLSDYTASLKHIVIITLCFGLLIALLHKYKIRRIIWIIFGVFVFLEYSLSIYYITNSILLDSVIYHYSFKELVYIFNSSGGLNLVIYIPIFLPIIFVVLNKFLKDKKAYKWTIGIILVLSIGLSFIHSSKRYDQVSTAYRTSKTVYLINSSLDFLFDGNLESDEIINSYWDSRPEFNYVKNSKFPLLREFQLDTVFSDQFNLKEVPPNIVFIMVESLSRSLSGTDAFYGSFTPFLDSLKDHSLYWKNHISNAERTFGVLPNCLGSLPYAQKGMIDSRIEEKYPKHTTIFNDLKHNLDYTTTFHYGGWAGFEKLDKWLQNQGIDILYEVASFDTTKFTMMTSNEDGFTWGYSDKDALSEMMNCQDTLEAPFFNIIQTLTMHEPYLFQEQDYYKGIVNEILENNNLSKKRNSSLLKNTMALSSVVYTDDKIRQYFNESKTKSWFDNTIFIIVGDHRIGSSIKLVNYLDRYHVPLMIYSPLLKKSNEFEGICFHNDIAPSLYSLFSINYNLPISKYVPWIGKNLNLSHTFYQDRFASIMRTNRKIDVVIDNDVFYYGEVTYKIGKDLSLTPFEDDMVLESIESKLSSFKSINSYVTKNNRIIH